MTTATRPATRHINPFGLRMQPELRAYLEATARSNGRSLNSEIVTRLEQSALADPPLDAAVAASPNSEDCNA